jgi:hypothetical protein
MNSKSGKLRSALGRSINPKYRTHQILLIITPILGIIAGAYSLFTGNEILIALHAGFWMALAVFQSWVVAREIDPDNDWSAFVAVALIVVAMFAFNFPVFSVLALFVTIIALRLSNRIVGFPATRNDLIMVIVLLVIAAFFDSWLIGLVAAAGLFLSATMSQAERSHLPFAGLSVVIVIVRGIINLGQTGSLSTNYLIAIVAIGIFYIVTMIANRSVTVKTDIKAQPVDIKRIRAAMALGLVAVVILALWRGDTGVIAMLPMWCTLLGISIYRVPITVRELSTFNRARQKA